MLKDFFQRLLSRKLLVTLGAILAASINGLDSTHTAIVAVLAGAYVLAEAAIDAANARPSANALIGDATKALELARAVQGGGSTAPPPAPVVVNVTSIPPPPAVPEIADPVRAAPTPEAEQNATPARPVRSGD